MNTLPELETSDKKKFLLNELKNRFKYKYLYHHPKKTYYSITFDNLKKTKRIYEIKNSDGKMLYISIFNKNYKKIHENVVHDSHCHTYNYKLKSFNLMPYVNMRHSDNYYYIPYDDYSTIKLLRQLNL